jgi:hypothetical protein
MCRMKGHGLTSGPSPHVERGAGVCYNNDLVPGTPLHVWRGAGGEAERRGVRLSAGLSPHRLCNHTKSGPGEDA